MFETQELKDILGNLKVIDKATKEVNSLVNGLSLEERLLYLYGLVRAMQIEGEIHPEQKDYIHIVIKSLEVDASILESFAGFEQSLDLNEETIQEFFFTFKRKPIAQLFLFDVLILIRKGDNYKENDKSVVDMVTEKLEVIKGTYNDSIEPFFRTLKTKPIPKIFSFEDLITKLQDSGVTEHEKSLIDTMAERLEVPQELYRAILNICDLPVSLEKDNIKIEINTSFLQPIFQAMLNRGDIDIIDNVVFHGGEEFPLSGVGMEYSLWSRSINIVENLVLLEYPFRNKYLS